MYEVNGYTYSLEEIKEAAEASGLGLQEYIIKNGMTTTEEAEVKRNNRGKINGFQKIINSVGDYFLGKDGDMETAWNNGIILAEAYDGINDVFELDTDDPNYSLTPEQAEAFYNSLKSRENLEEVKSMNDWNATFDKVVEDDRALVKDGKADDWGEVGRNVVAGIYATVKHGPGALLGVMAQSLRQGMDDDIMTKAAVAGTGAVGTVALAGQAGPQALIPEELVTAPTAFLSTAWGTMSYESEVINTFADLIREELGPDPSLEDIHEIFEDPEKIQKLKNKSRARGGTIAGFETLGFKGASKAANAIAKTTRRAGGSKVASVVAGGTASGAVEVPFSMAGEYFGQKAAGQKTDLKEVMLEGLAGLGTAPASAVTGIGSALVKPGTYLNKGKKTTREDIQDFINTADDADVVLSQFDIKDDADLANQYRERKRKAFIAQDVDARITDQADINAVVDLEIQLQDLGEAKTYSAKEKVKDIKAQINEIRDKYAKTGRLSDKARQRKESRAQVVEGLADQDFEANMEFAKKHSGLYGLNVVDQLSNQEIIEKYGDQYDGANGFILNDEIVINKEVAKTTGIEGANTANHELLHGIIKASGAKIKQPLINDFLNFIGEDNRAVIQQRIDDNYTADYMNKNKDEYFTIFSDAIENGDIKFNETVFTKIKDVVRRLFQDVGLAKVDFDTAEGVYNFVRDYNKSIHKGALSRSIKRDTKGSGVISEGKTSLSNKVEDRKINTDFKSRLDQFTGPAEQRKYTSDAEFKKSNDFANAALALEEDPAVLKKIEKEFIRYNVTPTAQNITDASRILSDKFMTTFNVEKNSLFGWAMGKTPVLTKAVNTVIEKETSRPDAGAASIDQTFGEDQRGFDVADDTDINDIIQNNIDGDKLRPRSKVGQKTMLNGEKLFDDDIVKTMKAKALEVLGKDYDITSDEFINFVTDEFNTTIRPVLQKKIGNEAAYRKFIEENHETDGDPFQEGNIPLADIVQMEKMEDNKVFTEEIQRNLKPKAVDAAVAANKLPKGTNRLSGPTLYKYGKPTVDDKVNFIYGVKGSKRGTRKDRTFLNLGLRAMFDMLVTQATETKVPQKQVTKLAAKLNVPQNVRFSKSSTYTKINTKQLANMFSKKFKSVEYYDVGTNVERYANDIVEVSKIFEEKYGAGFLGLSMINNKKGLKITSEQRSEIREIIKRELPNISKRNSEYAKTKFDKKLVANKSNAQLKIINKRNMMLHKEFWQTIRDIVSNDKSKIVPILHMLEISQNEGTHIHRLGAEYIGGHADVNQIQHFEHALQNANTYRLLMDAAVNQSKDNFAKTYEATVKNYKIIGLPNADNNLLNATDFKNKMSLDQSWSVFENNWWQRYFNETVGNAGGINPVNLVTLDGKTFAEEFGVDIYGRKSNLAIEQAKNKVKVKYPEVLKFSKSRPNNKILNDLNDYDTALRNAKNINAPKKGISIFDFDDTLATTKSKIIVNMPDGKVKKITPAEFAKQHSDLEQQGATFDFSEFNKVIDGKPALASKKLEKAIKKFGNKDVYVLTARPQQSAQAIYEFLKGIGLEIPLKNITGLENGTPQAKANWVVGKAAEGYNDFYFTDDVYKNVKAVQDALEILDVKSKSRIAYIDRVSKLDKDFNDILEAKTGIAAEKEYSPAKAQVVGAKKGRFKFFIPPSAEDFVGLLYPTLAKGKLGDNQMAWYKKNLLDPFARANANISRERIALMNDYKALKSQLNIVPKNLKKTIPGDTYTREQAVRVYIWNKQGMTVPGLSKTDLKDLVNYVNSDAALKTFGDQLININKDDGYAAPNSGWLAGTTTTDLLQNIGTTKRAKHLAEWQQNVDIIFSEKNLNKMEAAFGKAHRIALEGILKRMKTGRNRSFQTDSLTGKVTDWLTNSIGTIMFFNTRSALLQTISAVNFINFKDNNIFKAGKAYANQKQYWSDFMTLMNSDFLVDRRRGLRINVNEADIANMAQESGPRGVISKMLEIGFLPTQIADSFAIASGGATMYRNRINTYKKQGLSQKEAENKAFLDFREIAEEAQQSSRPDRISAQQAGPLGRIILAFGNTPMQYARLIKKAASDLKNRRGDWKTNVSKIIYYGAVQNLIFNALQQAIFAIAFGESDEDKEEKKYLSIANGMADSLLRGVGIAGAFVSVGKNAIIRIMNESEKPNPKYEKIGYELTRISPPISSKLSRLNQAARSLQWDKDEMMQKGFAYDNPAWLAGANVTSAITNVPVDRLVKKTTNVIDATSQDMEMWERLALLGGWQKWELDMTDDRKSKKSKSNKTKDGKVKRNF